MRFRSIGCAVVLLACGLPIDSRAASLTVEVINSQFTTSLSTSVDTFTKNKTLSSSEPISDTLVADPLPGIDTSNVRATATADLFDVSAFTTAHRSDGGDAHSFASALSVVGFAVGSDSVATLGITFNNDAIPFSQGFVSLNDVTTDTLLQGYSWTGLVPSPPVPDFGPAGTITFDPQCSCANVAFDQLFQTNHLYQLEMYTEANANRDTRSASIDVSGVVPTPEPATLLLFGPGVAAAVLHRRRRRRSLPGGGEPRHP